MVDLFFVFKVCALYSQKKKKGLSLNEMFHTIVIHVVCKCCLSPPPPLHTHRNFLYTCKPLYAAALYIARLTTTITALSTYCRTVFISLSLPLFAYCHLLWLVCVSSFSVYCWHISAHFFHNCCMSVTFLGLCPFDSHMSMGIDLCTYICTFFPWLLQVC